MHEEWQTLPRCSWAMSNHYLHLTESAFPRGSPALDPNLGFICSLDFRAGGWNHVP